MPSPPSSKSGHIHKATTRKMRRQKVLKILAAAMETNTAASGSSTGATSSSDYHNEFFNTGRVGRRNAMPDILGHHCTTSTADLPEQLSALSTQDSPSPGPSTSGAITTAEQSTTETVSSPSTSSS